MTTTSKRFAALLEASKNHGETRDCTVKALTAATGLPYGDCHKALADQGRRPRKGCHVHQMQKAATVLGYSMTRKERNTYSAKTMTTAPRDPRLRAGNLICATAGHVAALIDGEVIDWTSGRRHRIQDVYTVEAVQAAKVWKHYTKADQIDLF